MPGYRTRPTFWRDRRNIRTANGKLDGSSI
jgi:hypothetical protein